MLCVIKSSRATNRVSWLKVVAVSKPCVPIIRDLSITAQMIGADMVPETSVTFSQLTWLVAREDFINISSRGHKLHAYSTNFIHGTNKGHLN